MGVNIEIKARVRDWDRQFALAEGLADSSESLRQRDTFFNCCEGRLKLRDFENGRGELIAYERPSERGPKPSHYTIVQLDDVEGMRGALAQSLGIWREVRKRREVLMVGQTRVHFDEVEELGRFIELEVVLKPGQSSGEGEQIAAELMSRLDIRSEDLVAGAYADMSL